VDAVVHASIVSAICLTAWRAVYLSSAALPAGALQLTTAIVPSKRLASSTAQTGRRCQVTLAVAM